MGEIKQTWNCRASQTAVHLVQCQICSLFISQSSYRWLKACLTFTTVRPLARPCSPFSPSLPLLISNSILIFVTRSTEAAQRRPTGCKQGSASTCFYWTLFIYFFQFYNETNLCKCTWISGYAVSLLTVCVWCFMSLCVWCFMSNMATFLNNFNQTSKSTILKPFRPQWKNIYGLCHLYLYRVSYFFEDEVKMVIFKEQFALLFFYNRLYLFGRGKKKSNKHQYNLTHKGPIIKTSQAL